MNPWAIVSSILLGLSSLRACYISGYWTTSPNIYTLKYLLQNFFWAVHKPSVQAWPLHLAFVLPFCLIYLLPISDSVCKIHKASPRRARRRAVVFSDSFHETAAAAALNCLWYVVQDCFPPKGWWFYIGWTALYSLLLSVVSFCFATIFFFWPSALFLITDIWITFFPFLG